ncbi:MFS transporter [Microbacteriaceae bacterium VKM Ac-2855]|nr:MFS transporter [Microbacteriaceae bacterium VKM Ac-2855]
MTAPIEVTHDRTTNARARFPWIPVLILGFAWFLGVAIELGPAGLLNQIALDLGVSIAAAGTLTTFYALGNAILVVPLTALALRFARRPVLMIVMGALALSTVLVALAPSLLLADAGRFVGGGAYAVMCTLFPAVAIRIVGPGNAGKVLTVLFTATSLGTAFGAPIASLIGSATGWRVTFLGAAALVAVAGALMFSILPSTREHHEKDLGLLATARIPGVFRVSLGWALVMMAHFVIVTYIDAYIADRELPHFVTSLALALIGVGGIVGTLTVGLLSRRSFYAAIVTTPVVVAAGFIVFAAGGSNVVVILAGIALSGTGLSGMIIVFQQAVLLTGARAPETATSISVLLIQFGFAAGATIGGLTIETIGFAALPFVALVFALGAIGIAVSLRRVLHTAQANAAAAPR